MKTAQYIWKNNSWEAEAETPQLNPQFCLLFGTRENFDEGNEYYNSLKAKFPKSDIIAASTAGNIISDRLLDDVIVATCVELEKTEVKSKLFEFNDKEGKELGLEIGNYFNADDLSYMLVLSAAGINAGKLLDGINEVIQGKAGISGGVAGDNSKFEKTYVGLNEDIGEQKIIVIGFYGTNLVTNHGSQGGWDVFGPKRKVTKCEGNILYELDNRPVLDLYKEYLGPKAAELPASALYYPFTIIGAKENDFLVRGVQNTDEQAKSLILFGDVHEGDTVQLMKANFDRIIDGAADSATESLVKGMGEPDLSILISCVGRRIVLDQLVEEELEEAKKAIGQSTAICGFYSYSELSPVVGDNSCQLHNQTMTITSFYEKS